MDDLKYRQLKTHVRHHVRKAKNNNAPIEIQPVIVVDAMATVPIFEDGPPAKIRVSPADYEDLLTRLGGESPGAEDEDDVDVPVVDAPTP